jgi:predicted DsbA family dithiol-disulfide isomerase
MTQRQKTLVQLQVYSDVICPWCYVGKARLNQALGLVSGDWTVDIVWMPFELNPSMPEGGMDRQQYLINKFGSSDILGMEERLNAAGSPDGLQFNFGGIKKVPNTFNAHRLLWFAKTRAEQGGGEQDKLSEILFRKYFTDGIDIGDLEVLVAAATEAGISADDARKFLTSSKGSDEVREEESQGLSLRIHAVPTFVISGQVIASGAIAPGELCKLLERAAEDSLTKS